LLRKTHRNNSFYTQRGEEKRVFLPPEGVNGKRPIFPVGFR
jgi:hypothetical protein